MMKWQFSRIKSKVWNLILYSGNLYQSKEHAPVFPFETKDEEKSNLTDEEMAELVEMAKKHAMRGDTFQMVLSRRFEQQFSGDEFNVYRALRNINPSSYLFYFDYGSYKIFGSSPESQLIIKRSESNYPSYRRNI